MTTNLPFPTPNEPDCPCGDVGTGAPCVYNSASFSPLYFGEYEKVPLGTPACPPGYVPSPLDANGAVTACPSLPPE